MGGALALTVPIFRNDLLSVVLSFVCFEICVGVFFPCAGTLRAKVIPDKFQGSVMNVFRVPLNVLVVTGTKMTDLYPKETCFTVVVSWLLLAAVLQIALSQRWVRTTRARTARRKSEWTLRRSPAITALRMSAGFSINLQSSSCLLDTAEAPSAPSAAKD